MYSLCSCCQGNAPSIHSLICYIDHCRHDLKQQAEKLFDEERLQEVGIDPP